MDKSPQAQDAARRMGIAARLLFVVGSRLELLPYNSNREPHVHNWGGSLVVAIEGESIRLAGYLVGECLRRRGDGAIRDRREGRDRGGCRGPRLRLLCAALPL